MTNKEVEELRSKLEAEISQRKACADIVQTGFDCLMRSLVFGALPVDVARAMQALRALKS